MVESFVFVGDGWSFCGHLKESCHECLTDLRIFNNEKISPWLKQSGWPASAIQRVLRIAGVPETDLARPCHCIASRCNTHEKTDCPVCFNFGAFLLQDAELWGEHISYLTKAGIPRPPSFSPPPSTLFERRFPRLRGFPDIQSWHPTLAPAHTLTFTHPNFRLVDQLPSFTGHSPLGWILFLTVVSRRAGTGWSYTVKDASGTTVLLRFVENWALVEGGGDPTGEEAGQFRNMAPGTLLSLKCVTLSQTPSSEGQVAVERLNLCGVKILKSSMTELTSINDKLRRATPGSCAHCEKVDAPSSCKACKSPYCDKECQTKDWKDGGHKKACGTIAHLRSLNLMFTER